MNSTGEPGHEAEHFDSQHRGIQMHTGPATRERVQPSPTRVIFNLTTADAHASEFENGKETVDRTVEFVDMWYMR